MIATSQEKYVEYFTLKSVLLSPPKSDKNRKLRPSLFHSIHGIVGIRSYLDKLVNEQNQDGIIKYSLIAYAKKQLAEAKSRLEKLPGNQHVEDAKNKYSAQIKIFEAEARKCNQLLQQYEKTEEAEKEAKRAASVNKRTGRMGDNNQLVEWAGREVEQKNGVDVFKDDGSSVAEFKVVQNKTHLEKMAIQHEANLEAGRQKDALWTQ